MRCTWRRRACWAGNIQRRGGKARRIPPRLLRGGRDSVALFRIMRAASRDEQRAERREVCAVAAFVNDARRTVEDRGVPLRVRHGAGQTAGMPPSRLSAVLCVGLPAASAGRTLRDGATCLGISVSLPAFTG